jgi:hypothetical protein
MDRIVQRLDKINTTLEVPSDHFRGELLGFRSHGFEASKPTTKSRLRDASGLSSVPSDEAHLRTAATR